MIFGQNVIGFQNDMEQRESIRISVVTTFQWSCYILGNQESVSLGWVEQAWDSAGFPGGGIAIEVIWVLIGRVKMKLKLWMLKV